MISASGEKPRLNCVILPQNVCVCMNILQVKLCNMQIRIAFRRRGSEIVDLKYNIIKYACTCFNDIADIDAQTLI